MCDGCRFVIGNNNMVHLTGFYNTVPSPNTTRSKVGRNVQIGSNLNHRGLFRMWL